MTLFCGCGDWWPEPGDVFWYGPGDFSIYAKHRATKCISCGRRVAIGDVVGRFDRYKVPEEKIEVAIYGDDGEIPRANH